MVTESQKIHTLKKRLLVILLCLPLSRLLYHLLVSQRFPKAAAVSIGLPATGGLLLALRPPSRTATGRIIKGLTIGLLLTASLFSTSWIALLPVAPLCYAIGLMIGLAADTARRGQAWQAQSTRSLKD